MRSSRSHRSGAQVINVESTLQFQALRWQETSYIRSMERGTDQGTDQVRLWVTTNLNIMVGGHMHPETEFTCCVVDRSEDFGEILFQMSTQLRCDVTKIEILLFTKERKLLTTSKITRWEHLRDDDKIVANPRYRSKERSISEHKRGG